MKQAKELVRTGETVENMVRAIADLIVEGDLLPGEKLDELSLAARFEVSRTPVREALRQLCAMGLVERPPNKSAVVTNVSDDFLTSMFEAMAELESICARLAAERMTIRERLDLQDIHKASNVLVKACNIEAYAALNVEFHNLIYAGAHNAHIQGMVSQTRARLAPFRRAQFRLDGRLDQSWREHGKIVEAILCGDGQAAAAAAYGHVSIVGAASIVFARASEGG